MMVLAHVLIALLVQAPSSKAVDAEHEQFQDYTLTGFELRHLSVRVYLSRPDTIKR